MVARTTEITRAQANEGSRSDVAQQQFANQLQKEAKTSQETVNSANKGDEKQKIKADDQDRNKQKREKQKKQETKKGAGSSATTRRDGSLIDISI